MTGPYVRRGDRTPQDIPDITLGEFLRARLDEDERASGAAEHPGPWMAEEMYQDCWEVTATSGCVARENNSGDLGRGDAAHIARHDPARVLRDVEAKRRIIEHVERWEHDNPDHGGYYACPLVPGALSARESGECDCGLEARRMAILGPLAHEFADHPDYRAEEWAP